MSFLLKIKQPSFLWLVLLILSFGFSKMVNANDTINIDLYSYSAGVQPLDAFAPYFLVSNGEYEINDYTRPDFHPHPGRFVRQKSEGSYSTLNMDFADGLRSLTFVRMGTSMNASTPGWTLTLYDSLGTVLGAMGDGNTIIINGSIGTFTFSSPDERSIASALLENFYNGATMHTAPFIEWSFVFTTNPNPLPVEFASFDAMEVNESIMLNWVTASEINNKKFIVQRSEDGVKFENIGTVNGKGSPSSEHSYHFLDKAPGLGKNYYRLQQVDLDGRSRFSKIININLPFANKPTSGFYPNPSQVGVVNLDYYSNNEEVLTIWVFDLTGALLQKQEKHLYKGLNVLDFDFKSMNKGIKVVKLQDSQYRVFLERLHLM